MADNALEKALTNQEREFARNLADGHGPLNAYRLSGLSAAYPAQAADSLLKKPAILAYLHAETRKRLVSAAPMALNVIERLARDENVAPRVRLDAAKTILDRAGHIAPRAAAAQSTSETPLHEMSVDEMRRLADRLEAELASKARPVKAQSAQVPPANPLDLLA